MTYLEDRSLLNSSHKWRL